LLIKDQTNDQEKFKNLREYIHGNKNHKYADLAYHDIIDLIKYYGKNKKLMYKDMIYFFGINPNAWSNDLFLFFTSDIIKKMAGEDEMYKFLEMISKKYPSTEVSIVAKKIIEDEKIPEYVY